MRLLCACCVAEVLRICAPNVPYESRDVKVGIFVALRLLLCGNMQCTIVLRITFLFCYEPCAFWYPQRVFKLVISQLRRFLGKPEGPSFERIVSALDTIVQSESQIILVQVAENGDASLLVDLYDALLESAW